MSRMILSTSCLLAAAQCISTDETRYYLAGVSVQKHPEKGAMLVATDGHRMIVVHDQYAIVPERPMIVSLNWKAKELKVTPKDIGNRVLIVEVPEKRTSTPMMAQIMSVALDHADQYESDGLVKGALIVEEIDGTFPDWTRVVPWKTFDLQACTANVAFDPRYIATFSTAFSFLSFASDNTLVLRSGATGDPFIVTDPSVMNAFGILMPKRGGGMSAPLWLAHKAPPPPKEDTPEAA
ncbi:hypothetical protein [Tabrizicola sp. BL-A-41-H6]|uniref:hypothetical protein n=1 Tax=Tabrizicola sp. BL-A-41-H6 TaxID=3421107 RepID=UPI003D669B61